MAKRMITFKAHLVDAFWQTDDAVLVKTVKGKIWFCSKLTDQEFQQQLDNYQNNKPLAFTLKAREEINEKN